MAMNLNPTAEIDALTLMKEDLLIYRDDIRHKAEFKGCVKQLDAVREEFLLLISRRLETAKYTNRLVTTDASVQLQS